MRFELYAASSDLVDPLGYHPDLKKDPRVSVTEEKGYAGKVEYTYHVELCDLRDLMEFCQTVNYQLIIDGSKADEIASIMIFDDYIQ